MVGAVVDESGCFRSDELLKLGDRIQLAGSFKPRFKVTFQVNGIKKCPGLTLKGSRTRCWCRTLNILIRDVCLLHNFSLRISTKMANLITANEYFDSFLKCAHILPITVRLKHFVHFLYPQNVKME